MHFIIALLFQKYKEFDFLEKPTALQEERLKQTKERIDILGLVTTTEKELQEKVLFTFHLLNSKILYIYD